MTVLVGNAIQSVGFVICADVSLTYVLDCYQEVCRGDFLSHNAIAGEHDTYKYQIMGDSMVIIVFCRNIISVVMLFIYTPWITHVGIQNTFLIVAFLCIATLLGFPIALLFVGKKLRIRSIPAFEKYAAQQLGHR